MKYLLVVLLCLAFVSWTQAQTVSSLLKNLEIKDKLEDSRDFIDGLLRTSLGAEGVEISKWIDEDVEIIEEVEVLVAFIKDGIAKNMEDILLHFMNILIDTPSALVNCEKVPDEIYKFELWAQDFKNVTLMEYRIYEAIYYHPLTIMDSIEKMVVGLGTKNYTLPGEGIGEVLHLLFEEIQYQHIDEVFEGIRIMEEEMSSGQA